MQPPRVAYFPDSFHEVNGVAHTSRNFVAYAERHALPFLCVRAGGRSPTSLQSGELRTLELRRSRASIRLEKDLDFDMLFSRHAIAIRREFKRFRPNVIHITGPSELGIFGAYFAWELDVPLVASWHTNVHEYAARRMNWLTRRPSWVSCSLCGAVQPQICPHLRLCLSCEYCRQMRKLFALLVFSFALSPAFSLVFPQAAQVTAITPPSSAPQKESYWHKAVKPDILPIWIGGIAALLASIVGLKTLRSIDRQADIADRTLVSTFPPKLRIRVMELDISKALAKPIENGVAIWKLVVANIGDSIAHIQPFTITFDSVVEDVKETVYLLGTDKIEGFDLEAGSIKTFTSEITNAGEPLSVAKHMSDLGQYVWVRSTGYLFSQMLTELREESASDVSMT
jgi:hypothetical protein